MGDRKHPGHTEPCPRCGQEMENTGRESDEVFTSMPPQWDELLVCRACEVKKSVRVHGGGGFDLRTEFQEFEEM